MARKQSIKKADVLKWKARLDPVIPMKRWQKVAYDRLWKRSDLSRIERIRIRQAEYNARTGARWASYHKAWTDERLAAFLGLLNLRLSEPLPPDHQSQSKRRRGALLVQARCD